MNGCCTGKVQTIFCYACLRKIINHIKGKDIILLLLPLKKVDSIPAYKKRSYKKRLVEILGTKKQQLADYQIARNKFLWKLWNLQKNIDFLYIFHVLQEIYGQLLKI